MAVAPSGSVLEVDDLRVSFNTESGLVQAVDSVSFSLRRGEVLAIVGESGSGKSVTAMSMMGLTRGPNAKISGTAKLAGRDGDAQDLIAADEGTLQKIRGERLAMIFQDPMSSLNPVYRVGDQIAEMILAHRDVTKQEALAQSVELMNSVGIPGAQERVDNYPHEFSGGMRQRVMIAMALALDPEVLIADEPTTALDVTIQAQILRLIAKLNREQEVATILITHDLGVVAEIADRVLVMYGGRVIEVGTLEQIFYDPQHPYTWGLLGSVTRLDRPRMARLAQIEGQPPSLVNPPQGCHFRPRCKFEHDACKQVPALISRGGEAGHEDRCVLDPEKKPAARDEILSVTTSS
jgi:oligopeptide/dipeptide ABC transporter ATP-binding protein